MQHPLFILFSLRLYIYFFFLHHESKPPPLQEPPTPFTASLRSLPGVLKIICSLFPVYFCDFIFCLYAFGSIMSLICALNSVLFVRISVDLVRALYLLLFFLSFNATGVINQTICFYKLLCIMSILVALRFRLSSFFSSIRFL